MALATHRGEDAARLSGDDVTLVLVNQQEKGRGAKNEAVERL
jgi:hypothetical protein